MAFSRTHLVASAALLLGAAAVHPLAQEGPAKFDPSPAPFQLVLATSGLPAEGRWKSTPQIIDLNGDGLMDLLVHPRLGKKTGVWLGDGKGNWTDSSEGLGFKNNTTCGGSVAAVDINKDKTLDLVVADHCDGIFTFLGDGKGHWQLGVAKLNPTEGTKHEEEGENPFTGTEALAAGDIDEDGKLDLVSVGSDRGGFTIWIGDGSGKNFKEMPFAGLPNFEQPGEGEADGGGWAREVLLVDMNDDKHLDVVATYHRGPRVYAGDGKGSFKGASEGLPSPLLFGIFQQVEVVDMNHDKRLDLLTANTVNGPELYLQKPDGTWQTTSDVMPPMMGGATSVTAGDLDGDGNLDLITGGKLGKTGQYGIYALRNDGKGGFTAWKTAMPEDGMQVVWGLTSADIDGDKRMDVVATLGGAMGAGPAAPVPGKPAAPEAEAQGKFPHIQVWLNRAQ